MNVKIEIQCDTARELLAHLHMLQVQIQDEVKRLNLNEATEELPLEAAEQLYDDNCYGTHQVEISHD